MMSTRDNLTVLLYSYKKREEFCWRPGCFRLETSIKQVHPYVTARIIWWEARRRPARKVILIFSCCSARAWCFYFVNLKSIKFITERDSVLSSQQQQRYSMRE